MSAEQSDDSAEIDQQKLIELLNEDLAREYQAIIAYVVYSQVVTGAEYMSIARELETHAKEELEHALKLSKQIDYLGGVPTVEPKPVRMSDKSDDDPELSRPHTPVRGSGRICSRRGHTRDPGGRAGSRDRSRDGAGRAGSKNRVIALALRVIGAVLPSDIPKPKRAWRWKPRPDNRLGRSPIRGGSCNGKTQ